MPGNHDGLLCADDDCLACHHMRRCAGAAAWGATPQEAAAETRRRLVDGVCKEGLLGHDPATGQPIGPPAQS